MAQQGERGLQPQNILQAAQADFARSKRNQRRAELIVAGYVQDGDMGYEPYAFHRRHVRKATNTRELMVLALMEPQLVLGEKKSAKYNTRLIYSNAQLLLGAIKLARG